MRLERIIVLTYWADLIAVNLTTNHHDLEPPTMILNCVWIMSSEMFWFYIVLSIFLLKQNVPIDPYMLYQLFPIWAKSVEFL